MWRQDFWVKVVAGPQKSHGLRCKYGLTDSRNGNRHRNPWKIRPRSPQRTKTHTYPRFPLEVQCQLRQEKRPLYESRHFMSEFLTGRLTWEVYVLHQSLVGRTLRKQLKLKRVNLNLYSALSFRNISQCASNQQTDETLT